MYEISGTLGSKIPVLGDPKAIAHLLAKDTYIYHQLKIVRVLTWQLVSPDTSVNSFRVSNLSLQFGNVVLNVMEGEIHKKFV